MSQATQECDNCHKPFPESKIATHFGYCRRNIKPCPQCHEMYDINYQEQHEEEFHKKQPCQYCKAQFPAADLSKHTQNCSAKTKYCEYCELNVPVGEYAGHLRACEARTKQCDRCRKPITNKEYLVHLTTCRGATEAETPNNTHSYEEYLRRARKEATEVRVPEQYRNSRPEDKRREEKVVEPTRNFHKVDNARIPEGGSGVARIAYQGSKPSNQPATRQPIAGTQMAPSRNAGQQQQRQPWGQVPASREYSNYGNKPATTITTSTHKPIFSHQVSEPRAEQAFRKEQSRKQEERQGSQRQDTRPTNYPSSQHVHSSGYSNNQGSRRQIQQPQGYGHSGKDLGTRVSGQANQNILYRQEKKQEKKEPPYTRDPNFKDNTRDPYSKDIYSQYPTTNNPKTSQPSRQVQAPRRPVQPPSRQVQPPRRQVQAPRRQQRTFDPRDYGGYSQQVPPQALFPDPPTPGFQDEDEMLQKAIEQSMRAHLNIPKELQSQDLMNSSFYMDMMDVERQRAREEELKRQANHRRR